MEIDKSNMRQVIIDSAKQLRDGLDLVPTDLLSRILGEDGTKNISIKGNFKNVVVCGIGGSALPVDVLNTIMITKIPVYIHRDYDLPPFTNKESLLIFISYSGNTEEVISSINKALSEKISSIGMSSGGQLEELCKKNNIPFVKIPSGIQPRLATGYLFSALAKVLSNLSIIDDISEEIIKTSADLEKLNPEFENEAKNLSKELIGKIPIVYSSAKFKDVAKIWKIKFNENSKAPSFYNYFPELNHNEMVGFSMIDESSNFYFIIIKDKDDHERNQKRMDLFTSLLQKKGPKIHFIEVRGNSMLYKVFSALLLGDWVSYFLALDKKIDPTPVQMVEEFKELLKK